MFAAFPSRRPPAPPTERHWITNKRRFMTMRERLALFAFPARYQRAGLSDSSFGRLLGNSIVVSVLAPLIQEVLLAAGLARAAVRR